MAFLLSGVLGVASHAASEARDAGTTSPAKAIATPAARATPVTQVVDWRWQPRLVEGPGKLRLDPSGSLVLDAVFPGGTAPSMGPGDGVQVFVESLGTTVAGSVARVPAPGESDRSRVVVRLPLDSRLHAGLDARLQVSVRGRRVAVVPPAAILREGSATYIVLRTASGKDEKRPVSIGAAFPDGELEVVSGLASGEVILVPPR